MQENNKQKRKENGSNLERKMLRRMGRTKEGWRQIGRSEGREIPPPGQLNNTSITMKTRSITP